MKRRTTPRITTTLTSLLLTLALLSAACGSGDETVSASPAATDSANDDAAADAADDAPAQQNEAPVNETEIANTPEPVDPKLVAPTDVVPSPDSDSVLWVRFTGGDPNCTAARVTVLRATPDDVAISLEVGITEDALVKSCLAGEFDLRVAVDLGEPLAGRPVNAEQPSGDDAEAPLITPELSTDDLVGLTEAEVAALADANLFPWRVTRSDDEFFMVTEDFNPGRVNIELEDGLVVLATLG